MDSLARGNGADEVVDEAMKSGEVGEGRGRHTPTISLLASRSPAVPLDVPGEVYPSMSHRGRDFVKRTTLAKHAGL